MSAIQFIFDEIIFNCGIVIIFCCLLNDSLCPIYYYCIYSAIVKPFLLSAQVLHFPSILNLALLFPFFLPTQPHSHACSLFTPDSPQSLVLLLFKSYRKLPLKDHLLDTACPQALPLLYNTTSPTPHSELSSSEQL